MALNIPADQINTEALAIVIDKGIEAVNGVYCGTKFCIGEFKTGSGEKAQIHLVITREDDELMETVQECFFD